MYDMHYDLNALAKEAELKVWDIALPLHWYEDVHNKTGYWPQEYGFVWCYDTSSVFGEPFPLTMAAKILLAYYTHLCKDTRMGWLHR